MVDIVKDVQKAQAWLRENTDKAALFEKRYGEGSALAVLNGTYQAPAAPDAPTESGADGMFEDVLKSIPAGITNAVRETTQFVGDLMEGASNLVGDETMIHRVDRDGDGKLDLLPMIGNKETYAKYVAENFEEGNRPANLQEIAEVITPENVSMGLIPNERSTVVGGFTEGITQFLTGMVGAGKLTGLKPFKSIGGGMATGAIADAVAFDPDTANLVRMLDEQFGISSEITTEILANDDENDWMNRLKNAGTGTLIGAPFDAVAIMIRFAKVKNKAQQELNTNGEISKETLDEAQALEEEVTKFSDLAGKPKGQMVEGKFVTDEGMVFDPSTGARDLQAEAKFKNSTSKVESSEAPTAPKASADSPTSPEIPSAPVAVSVDSVGATQPKLPKRPSQIIQAKKFSDAAVAARAAKTPLTPATLDDISSDAFNWSKMDGPMDAVKLMDEMDNVLEKSGVKKRMGLDKPQTLKEVETKAFEGLSEFVDNPIAVRNNLQKLELNSRNMAVEVVKGKMVLQSVTREIANVAEQIANLKANGNVDTILERKLLDLSDLHMDLQASVKGVQTAGARATSAGRIRTADAVDDITLDRLEAFGGSKKVQELALRLKATKGNNRGTAQIIREAGARKWMGVVNEVWLNAILSGPRTHLMNLGSNSINMFLRPAQRMVGGALTGNPQQMEEGFKQYVYMTSELFDSLRYLASVSRYGKGSSLADAVRSFKNEDGVLDTASKFDFNQSGASRTIGGMAGKFVRGAGRFLQAEDEFFKQVVFRSRLKAKVMANASRLSDAQLTDMGFLSRDAYISETVDGAVLNKQDLASRWDAMVKLGRVSDDAEAKDAFINTNLGTYNHNSEMAKLALEEAREATFTTPLRKDTFSRSVQDMINRFPLLRQVIPFIQTPTNILRVSFERVPALGLFAGRQLEMLRNGTPDQKAMVMGQQALGVAISYQAYQFAMSGKITGGGPSFKDDIEKAKLWNASPDWQPYSVNIGTTEEPQWIELKKLDPHGMLFGIIGDVVEMAEYTRESPDFELENLFGMISAAVTNNVASKTYVMSMTETMNLLSGHAKPWEWEAFFTNKAASMVPYSGLMYQANQIQDDHMRDLRTLTDKIKSRIYGANDAAVKHDWLTGEAVDTPEYMLGFVRQKKVDNGEHQAADVYKELRNLNYAFSGPSRKVADIKIPPVVFQRLNELIGTTRVNKRTLIQELDRQIKSAGYKKASDAAAISPVKPADDPRVIFLNKIIQGYKDIALNRLYSEYPELYKSVQMNAGITKAIRSGSEEARDLESKKVKEFSITQ
jgi:hypothetical protein